MIVDIGRISNWNASKHEGSVYSDATHRTYFVQKRAFGRIRREPIVGDFVTIDQLDSRLKNRVLAGRIRGLETKKSSMGTVLLVLLFFAAVFLVWKSGILDSFSITKTEVPGKSEAPRLLPR